MVSSLQEFRQRRAEHGFKRVEVCVPVVDDELFRRLGKALAKDDERAERLRSALGKILPSTSPQMFKDWLASLPDDEEDQVDGSEVPVASPRSPNLGK